ncbi:uncharacterized protein JNUCC1_03430 [Lentibacillus sp. JNUCC-1]|uniref:YrrS family protein n=1 Tax=Lentibacillus sp. JNUCC-1 TaxID=2654513 RepID=UPI001325235F|nr:YrrS family protein [Lentibacillus sp. JNUCC-1]MUV39552.1 uncharacterized protein [Lentibacillus sp. JNUCC-1]
MSDFNEQSRINRHEKRRKNTKLISILLIAGTILVIVLIGFALFGDGGAEENDSPDNDKQATENNTQDKNAEADEHTNQSNDTSQNDEEQSEDGSNQQNDQENSETNDDHEKAEQLESDDDNVIEAFTRHWEPIGTEQSGPHTVTYSDGSQDRIEMEKAMRLAANVDEEDVLYLWLENNGDQKVRATFSNREQNQHYRVYLTWVDQEGWKPTRVEILKENDQKYRFQN